MALTSQTIRRKAAKKRVQRPAPPITPSSSQPTPNPSRHATPKTPRKHARGRPVKHTAIARRIPTKPPPANLKEQHVPLPLPTPSASPLNLDHARSHLTD